MQAWVKHRVKSIGTLWGLSAGTGYYLPRISPLMIGVEVELVAEVRGSRPVGRLVAWGGTIGGAPGNFVTLGSTAISPRRRTSVDCSRGQFVSTGRGSDTCSLGFADLPGSLGTPPVRTGALSQVTALNPIAATPNNVLYSKNWRRVGYCGSGRLAFFWTFMVFLTIQTYGCDRSKWPYVKAKGSKVKAQRHGKG